MATERELRKQEEEAEKLLDEARNPYSWKRHKWLIIALVVICAGIYFYPG